MKYILKHCGAKVVFVAGKPQLEKLLSVRGNLPELENIVAADAGEAGDAGEAEEYGPSQESNPGLVAAPPDIER